MESNTDPARGRWGQVRRLAFIDLRLQFEGRLRRADLTSHFGISVPQASQDLTDYKKLAEANLVYDPSSKYTVALNTFRAVFPQTTAALYLDELHRLESGVVTKEESFVGFRPPMGVVATPARALAATEVSRCVEAIRDAKTLDVEYNSMSVDEPVRRVIAPHALGWDGLRWHVRAFCFARQAFHDFAIGRMHDVRILDVHGIDPANDVDWHTEVDIVLVPNPKLTVSQRHAVMRDYGMLKNGKLPVPCRKAMVFYTLRHLNLDVDELSKPPATHHVVVENRSEVDRWVCEAKQVIR